LQAEATYTLYAGDGEVVTFEFADSAVTWLNESGVTEAAAMGRGGFGGGGRAPGGGRTRPEPPAADDTAQ